MLLQKLEQKACLESHYGSIDKAYAQSSNGKYVDAIGEINQVLNKYGL